VHSDLTATTTSADRWLQTGGWSRPGPPPPTTQGTGGGVELASCLRVKAECSMIVPLRWLRWAPRSLTNPTAVLMSW
jgi:hypothetical protein